MGYITTVLTPEERRRAGPKNGAHATATVALDPLGAVSVHVASAPQGQGHRTVLAQIVADVFGLAPKDIRVVTELDTARDAWSIASGNYSSRFAAAVGGAAHLAAMRLKAKLARTAAAQLNVPADAIEFAEGRVRARGNPDNSMPVRAACRRRPLVARHDCRGRRGAARDRVLDRAGTDRADGRRRDQLLALPRLHLRFLRRSRSTASAAPCASTNT